MSTAQDRTIPQDELQPDVLPPNVRIIESSCETADSRTSDFSKWTTILREPILVQRGSEIQIHSNFIDMRGMTEDIIQFNQDGNEQSNTHRLLAQMYITNDGTNGKTCSYDYMSRGDTSFEILDPGSGYNLIAGSDVFFNYNDPSGSAQTVQIGGSGTGMTVTNALRVIRPNSITITNGGANYRNGLTFTLLNTTTTRGFIQTDDLGVIKKIFITEQDPNQTQPLGGFTQTDIIFEDAGVGSGLVCVLTTQQNGLVQCSPGDLINIPDNAYGLEGTITYSSGGSLPSNSTFYAQVKVVQLQTNSSIKNGLPRNQQSFLDPGYNYQNIPLHRWCPTFSVNDDFCYGFGVGTRTFTKGDGQILTIQNPLSIHNTDYCISAGRLMMNKEDEFVPGIYHTKGTNQEFKIAKAIPKLTGALIKGDTNNKFSFGFDGYSNYLQTPVYDVTQHGQTLNASVSRQFPIGSTMMLYFLMSDTSNNIIASPSLQQLEDLSAFMTKYGGQYQISSIDSSTTTGDESNDVNIVRLGGQNLSGVPVDQDMFITGDSNSAFPANQSGLIIDLDYGGTDNSSQTGTPTLQLSVDTDSSGNITLFSVSQDGTSKNYPGNYYSISTTTYPGNTLKFYLVSTNRSSNTSVSPMPFNETFTLNSITFTSGGVSYYAVPYWMNTNLYDRQNEVGKQPSLQPSQGATFDVVPGLYPATYDTQFLTTPTDIASKSSSDLVTGNVNTGLYREQGQYDTTLASFNPRLGAFVNHSTTCDAKITSTSVNANNKQSLTLSFGSGSDILFPFGSGSDDWLRDSNTTLKRQIRIVKANWDASYSYSLLPIQTYLVVNKNTSTEQHILTGGFTSDATYYYIDVIQSNCNASRNNLRFFGSSGATFMGQATAFDNPDFFITQNGQSYSSLTFDYINNYLTCNTKLTFQWGDGTANNITNTGTMALGAQQNFFGNNDSNLTKINTINPEVGYLGDAVLDTYNNGGFYFLTHFKELLVNSTNTQKYNAQTSQVINKTGIPMFITSLSSSSYIDNVPDQTIVQTPSDENGNQIQTTISNIYDYEPLYRDKTFVIDKNFALPSDISALWTRSAHQLKGAIDMVNGTEYVSADKSGLLQNEFCFPVYGSNNRINANGEYIKDTDLFPTSGGLEPGHVVGIAFVDNDNDWLAAELKFNLPKDADNNSFYFVFFRSPFTFIRTYDPLAVVSNNPDRTPLLTLFQTADKIGNAGDLALSGTVVGNVNNQVTSGGAGYEVDGTYSDSSGKTVIKVHTLSGTAIATYGILTMDSAFTGGSFSPNLGVGGTPNPTGTANLTINNILKNIRCFELGESTGVVNSTVSFETSSPTYPVYYLQPEDKSLYPKAKASQYIGSPNITLAFDTDISTFTFQFLHSPYTSPFIDNEGGDNAIRIFYGNRKGGIYNHETLSGVNVMNYCRPDYSFGVFTFDDTQNNVTTPEYPNGVSPLIGVSQNGLTFLNKLGFTNQNLSVAKVGGKLQIDTTLGTVGYNITSYSQNLDSEFSDPTSGQTFSITSKQVEFKGTTGSDVDVSDSIISQIPPPENQPGLDSYNQVINTNLGQKVIKVQRWGDFIYYPYSVSQDTNTFQASDLTRFDNASTTNGSIGGLLLSNSSRGMGLPNTLGSTFLTDDSSIPRTLNPDAELYIAYTISCGSSEKRASLLPNKLENGFLCVLSSVMRDAPMYLSGVNGFVNAMSIINKAFIQGDFIYSAGMLSFYAKEDYYLSEITTSIVNNKLQPPTTLGEKSSVIYQITNYNPTPFQQLPTTEQIQEQSILMQQAARKEMKGIKQSKPSALTQLTDDLYELGVLQLTDPSNDAIDTVRQQIDQYDIPNLSKKELNEFLKTPEGQAFSDNARDVREIEKRREELEQAYSSGAPTLNLERQFEDEMRERTDRINERVEKHPLVDRRETLSPPPSIFVREPEEPVMARGGPLTPEPRRRGVRRPTPTRTSVLRGQTPEREPEEGKIYQGDIRGKTMNRAFPSPEKARQTDAEFRRLGDLRDELRGISPTGKKKRGRLSKTNKARDDEIKRQQDELVGQFPLLPQEQQVRQRRRRRPALQPAIAQREYQPLSPQPERKE